MALELKVAWLCPFPLQAIGDIPVACRNRGHHFATWIVNLSMAIRDFLPGIELDIITETARVSKSFIVCKDGINFHVMRSGSSIPFTLRGFPSYLPADVLSFFMLNRYLLINELEKIKPDLVHAHGTETVYGLTAVTSRYPAVVSIQGVIAELARQTGNRGYAILKHLEKLTIKRGRFFIAKTPFARKFVQSVHPMAKVFDIENPVHEAFFSVKRSDKPDRVVLFVGSVIREKGIGELIEAFSNVNNGILRIIGVGTSSYMTTLRKKVDSLGIAKKVTWMGDRSSEEIAREFERAAVLALPSYMETSPNTISEAMCAGVPVVATAVGGIPDMITQGKTGLLIDSRNVDQLARAINHVLDNTAMARQMAESARKEGFSRFSGRKAAEKTMAAYEKIIAETTN